MQTSWMFNRIKEQKKEEEVQNISSIHHDEKGLYPPLQLLSRFLTVQPEI